MDPKACLLEAREAIFAQDFDTARERLAEYGAWRMGRGFEPEVDVGKYQPNVFKGDKLARLLRDRLRELHESEV